MSVQTNRGPMTPESLLGDLIYASYRHNRELSPHIRPEAWAQVLPNVPAMEARLQAEWAIEKAAA